MAMLENDAVTKLNQTFKQTSRTNKKLNNLLKEVQQQATNGQQKPQQPVKEQEGTKQQPNSFKPRANNQQQPQQTQQNQNRLTKNLRMQKVIKIEI